MTSFTIKTTATILALLSSLPIASCAEIQKRPASVTVHVVDQDGNRIPELQVYATGSWPLYGTDSGAVASGSYQLNMPIATPLLTIGYGPGGITPQKGYYADGRIRYIFSDKHTPLTHWSPWNPNIYRVCKKIQNPLPMHIPIQGRDAYAGNYSHNLRWPVEIDQEIGYDFVVADWVSPYGRGKLSDVFIKVADVDQKRPKPTRYRDVMMRPFFKTTFRFPGSDNGVILFRPLFRLGEGDRAPFGSALWHDYEAPRTGYVSTFVSDPEAEEAAQRINPPENASDYQSEATRNHDKLILRRGTMKEYGFTTYGSGPEAEAAFQRLLEAKEVYVRPSAYFRIHSKRLESGEIIGMHGVMDTDAIGQWRMGKGNDDIHIEVRLRYKLNPDTGSRSLEWNGINLSKPYPDDHDTYPKMIGISPADPRARQPRKHPPDEAVCP